MKLKTLLALMLFVPLSAFAQSPFSRIVVFGTSLSDPGNAYAILGEASTPPHYSVDTSLIPDRPYARGGHHFTNGDTWVEQLAKPLGLASSVRPAFAGLPGATNFAFGGARARAAGDSPHLALQLGAFLYASGGSVPADALYVIEMGANDIRDALMTFAGASDLAGALGILDAAAQAIKDAIAVLRSRGATHFLVWNAPNVGLAPAVRAAGAQAPATFLTDYFNSQLTLDSAIPRLDVYAKLNAVAGSPQAFGFTNSEDACITLEAPFTCGNANEYVFWDGIHPTTAAHGIIAKEASTILH